MSFAERAQKAVQGSPQTAVVHVDGLVVLKIVKHCRDSLPQMAAGTLLGLDQGSTLEATHCFPRPAAKAEIAELNTTGEGADDPVEDEDEDGEAYQLEMMKMLREVNVDNNCVGWYKSMHLGSFCQTPLIETQFAYQETLSDNCVVLLYDPIQTAHGNLTLKARPVARATRASSRARAMSRASCPGSRALRRLFARACAQAYRLSDDFVTAFRAKKLDLSAPASQILVELPVKIRNPGLVNALLYDIAERHPGSLDVDFDRFDLSSNPYLEKHLEYLCHWVDDLAEEQSKFGFYMRNVARQKQEQARWAQKRRGEDDEEKPPEDSWRAVAPPSRLDSLLITNQIQEYCCQINRHTHSSFSKLFLTGSLHKKTT